MWTIISELSFRPIIIRLASFFLLEFVGFLKEYFSVFLRGVTWIRDSHGLFDYESKSISKKSCKTAVPSKIVRIENDIDIVQLGKNVQELGETAQTLL